MSIGTSAGSPASAPSTSSIARSSSRAREALEELSKAALRGTLVASSAGKSGSTSTGVSPQAAASRPGRSAAQQPTATGAITPTKERDGRARRETIMVAIRATAVPTDPWGQTSRNPRPVVAPSRIGRATGTTGTPDRLPVVSPRRPSPLVRGRAGRIHSPIRAEARCAPSTDLGEYRAAAAAPDPASATPESREDARVGASKERGAEIV
jgi:hypothetical protein